MPLITIISHRARLVTATARGKVTAADIEGLFSQLTEAQALSYPILVDVRGASIDFSPNEVTAHLGAIAAHASKGAIGSLALILDSTTVVNPRVTHSLAADKRSLVLFENWREATEWLRSHHPVELEARQVRWPARTINR